MENRGSPIFCAKARRKPACLEVCEPLTLRRFSGTQLQSSVYWLLYCAAFIPQWWQL